MSIDALRWAFKVSVGNPTRKLLLIALADYADEENFCWPSQKKLSERAECSLDSIQRHLAILEEDGFIKRERGSGRPGGGKASDSYELLVSAVSMASADESRNLRSSPRKPQSAAIESARKPQIAAITKAANCGHQWPQNAAINSRKMRLSHKEESPIGIPHKNPPSHSSASLQNDSGALRAEEDLEVGKTIDKKIQITERKSKPRYDLSKYKYVGRTIRLTDEDYDKWLKLYPAIKDLDSELDRADQFYTDNPSRKGWFFAVSNWLKKENEKTLEKIRRNAPEGAIIMSNGQVFSRW